MLFSPDLVRKRVEAHLIGYMLGVESARKSLAQAEYRIKTELERMRKEYELRFNKNFSKSTNQYLGYKESK